ncbi:MAG: hypothetical protein C0468_03270 [Planctomyces sp.]|nr:hypothetical protein [Planctomyces sp.]
MPTNADDAPDATHARLQRIEELVMELDHALARAARHAQEQDRVIAALISRAEAIELRLRHAPPAPPAPPDAHDQHPEPTPEP